MTATVHNNCKADLCWSLRMEVVASVQPTSITTDHSTCICTSISTSASTGCLKVNDSELPSKLANRLSLFYFRFSECCWHLSCRVFPGNLNWRCFNVGTVVVIGIGLCGTLSHMICLGFVVCDLDEVQTRILSDVALGKGPVVRELLTTIDQSLPCGCKAAFVGFENLLQLANSSRLFQVAEHKCVSVQRFAGNLHSLLGASHTGEYPERKQWSVKEPPPTRATSSNNAETQQ